jgi:hypothetical protein
MSNDGGVVAEGSAARAVQPCWVKRCGGCTGEDMINVIRLKGQVKNNMFPV